MLYYFNFYKLYNFLYFKKVKKFKFKPRNAIYFFKIPYYREKYIWLTFLKIYNNFFLKKKKHTLYTLSFWWKSFLFIKKCRRIFYRFFFYKGDKKFFTFIVHNSKPIKPYILEYFYFNTYGFILNFFFNDFIFFYKILKLNVIYFNKKPLYNVWKRIICNDSFNFYWNNFFFYKFNFNKKSYSTFFQKKLFLYLYKKHKYKINPKHISKSLNINLYFDYRNNLGLIRNIYNKYTFVDSFNWSSFSSYNWKIKT